MINRNWMRLCIEKHALAHIEEVKRFKSFHLQGAATAPKKIMKALDFASSESGGGLNSLPHENISGKITPALLKGMESSDWKDSQMHQTWSWDCYVVCSRR